MPTPMLFSSEGRVMVPADQVVTHLAMWQKVYPCHPVRKREGGRGRVGGGRIYSQLASRKCTKKRSYSLLDSDRHGAVAQRALA